MMIIDIGYDYDEDEDFSEELKVIAAEGEHKASRALRHAAEVKMSIVFVDINTQTF